jgi:alkanesulfonate monooxygenase SsuD/methylene tetrahydromethanopterin reductase-like flavin-dependent oxidoreductase (luciferase family)
MLNKPITFHWMWRRHWQISDSIENLDLDGILRMAQELDGANVKSVLLPYGPGGIDFSLVIKDALEKTNQLIMTIALPAYGVSPDYAAKILETLNRFAPGRIGVNLVAGRWGDEGNGPSEKLVIDHYMHDSSLIDTLEKRVAISKVWMDKVMALMKSHKHKTHMAVVGSSDTTIEIANKHCEYIYVDDNLLRRPEQYAKITNSKPILIVDPLIIEKPEDVNNVVYDDNAPPRKQFHHIVGTHDEVVAAIKSIAEKFNIYDFMIHTDQKDISKLLKLVKEFDKVPSDNKGEMEHFDISNDDRRPEGSTIHHEIFERIGIKENNLKVFSNFISPEECKTIVESIKNTTPSSQKPVQFGPEQQPLTFRKDWDTSPYIEKYKNIVKGIVEAEYPVRVINRSAKIAEWTKNDVYDLHINDLGINDFNNMSATIYLNDDFEGGEYHFPAQNKTFRPKVGDLIIFPGNMYYNHIISRITSGSRYTIPLWYTFI